MASPSKSVDDQNRIERAAFCLSRSVDLVTEAEAEAPLTQEICKLLVQIGYRMAWVGCTQAPPDMRVKVRAQAGDNGHYLEHAEITWADVPRGQGPTGRAIRENVSRSARHIATDPAFAPWRKDALARGYGSSLALPMVAGGRILGALNVYAVESDAFDTEELYLLEHVSSNLAHGIFRIRAAEERDRAQALSTDRTLIVRAIFEASPDMIFLHGADGQVLEVSARAAERYGYETTEFPTLNMPDLSGSAMDPAAGFMHLQRAQAGEDVDFEWVARARDGEEFPVEVRLRQITLQEGKLVLAIVRELSERKKAEAESRALEEMSSMSILAGGIAHDFNNMLTGILGNLGLAGLDLPGPTRALIAEAEEATMEAAGLTQELLKYTTGSSVVAESRDASEVLATATRFALRGSTLAPVLRTPKLLWPSAMSAKDLSWVVQNICLRFSALEEEGKHLCIEANNIHLDKDEVVGLDGGDYLSVIFELTALQRLIDVGHKVAKGTRLRSVDSAALDLSSSAAIVKSRHGKLVESGAAGSGAVQLFVPARPR